MQIVYISNRPQNLLETIQHVAFFMPFIRNIVACVPDIQAEALAASDSPLPLRVIGESDLLSEAEIEGLSKLDHQRRNYLLRCRLIEKGALDERFIMSDDDARPLKPVPIEFFFEHDKYHHYYFHDLMQWNNNQTEFDAGQISTGSILQYHNFPHLSYASHMPQIIDRELFIEAAQFFEPFAVRHPICEWGSYFNYALAQHPEQFHKPSFFKTLSWPEHPLAWKLLAQPSQYVFENVAPSSYEHGQVFAGLTSMHNSIEKIIRWRQYVIECCHPEQGSHWQKYLKPRTWVNKLMQHRTNNS